MLTDEQYKRVSRHLMRRVGIDKNMMTYRLLSREVGISVQQAKQALERWIDDPSLKGRGIEIVWCLVSSARDSTSTSAGKTFKLVRGTEATKDESYDSKFGYAVVPNSAASLSSLTNCSLSSVSEAEQAKWPAYDGEPWSIKHPDGDRKKAKHSKAAVTKPERVASISKSTASTSKATGGSSSKELKQPKKEEKPASGFTFGKLFQDKNKAVPAKRTNSGSGEDSSSKKVKKEKATKKVKNGLFDDDISDDDIEMQPADDGKKAPSRASTTGSSKGAQPPKDDTDVLMELFNDDDDAEMEAAMMAEAESKPVVTSAKAAPAAAKAKQASPATSKKAGTLASFFKK